MLVATSFPVFIFLAISISHLTELSFSHMTQTKLCRVFIFLRGLNDIHNKVHNNKYLHN